MKLIVGLGNPGRDYLDTRHNIGFSVLRSLAQDYKAEFKREGRIAAFSVRVRLASHVAILAMPQTFMNLSGQAVSALLKKYKLELADLLVVCDDLDLEFGRIRLRQLGSSGGHRGLESIIQALGSFDFARLRVGIGRPDKRNDAAEFVLDRFNKQEKEQLKEIVEKAADCCRTWVNDGIARTMNAFNQRTRVGKKRN